MVESNAAAVSYFLWYSVLLGPTHGKKTKCEKALFIWHCYDMHPIFAFKHRLIVVSLSWLKGRNYKNKRRKMDNMVQ